MDMMEFLRTRRTYRRFEQRPVAPEILQECVDAARIASCGANRQTVKYIIVQSPEAVAAGLTADGVCGCNSWKKITEAVVGIGRTSTVIDK